MRDLYKMTLSNVQLQACNIMLIPCKIQFRLCHHKLQTVKLNRKKLKRNKKEFLKKNHLSILFIRSNIQSWNYEYWFFFIKICNLFFGSKQILICLRIRTDQKVFIQLFIFTVYLDVQTEICFESKKDPPKLWKKIRIRSFRIRSLIWWTR